MGREAGVDSRQNEHRQRRIFSGDRTVFTHSFTNQGVSEVFTEQM